MFHDHKFKQKHGCHWTILLLGYFIVFFWGIWVGAAILMLVLTLVHEICALMSL